MHSEYKYRCRHAHSFVLRAYVQYAKLTNHAISFGMGKGNGDITACVYVYADATEMRLLIGVAREPLLSGSSKHKFGSLIKVNLSQLWAKAVSGQMGIRSARYEHSPQAYVVLYYP